MCVHKPNALCNECRTQRTKCEYPGKTNVGAGSGAGASLPTKGWPVVVVPPPKCKRLEGRHQEVAVQEQVNEVGEGWLEGGCGMGRTMGPMNVGGLLVARAGVTW